MPRYSVMLKSSWPGNFRRTVYDETGNVLRTLEFSPGVPVEIDEEELAAITGDLEHSMVHVRLDDKGRPRISDVPVEVVDSGEISRPDLENEEQREKTLQDADAAADLNIARVADLGLSKQVQKALETAEIVLVDQLREYVESGFDLTEIEGIGEKSAEEIKQKLGEHDSQ